MKVRPYQESDLSEMLELWHEFDTVHVISDPQRFKFPTPEQLRQRHGRYTAPSTPDTRFLYVVCADEQAPVKAAGTKSPERIQGFLCGAIRETPDVALLAPETFAELHAIFVRPGFRSGEASSILVQTAEDFAKSQGAKRIVCHIWDFNHAAEKHVQNLGFVRVSSKYEKIL